ncbi:uncharacterized protein LOC135333176 isoform X2 [Halichondria panicea]|uniref:uncharacterized protein LOC135333176 isoform X2 n=1 Tax=Halichondria panicea TaxID=6063 RepID=UPI00312BAD2E
MSKATRRQSYVSVEDEKQNLVEHFEKVQGRIDDFLKQGKSLVLVLKKRVTVDKDHVKNVQKMVQSIHDDGQTKHMKFQGSLDSSWNGIKEQLTSEAMQTSRIASTLELQALQPLQTFLINDLEKRFRVTVSDSRKLLKDYFTAKAALQKSRDKYFSVVGDWEVVMLELYHEQGDSWNPAPGNKLHDREAQLSRKVQESKEDYETAVQYLNQLQQDVFTSQLPGVLDILRTTAQNMVAVVNNALKCFTDMQSQLMLGNGLKGAQSHDQFNAADYCQTVIFCNVEYGSIPLPTCHEFQEYLYKDETLMIQARKVQYMCMSKLSPKELASRAHQFLADGDKKKQHSNNKGLSSTQEGSRLLIELCLEYLMRPVALKEEGLFRVSGDSAVMKSLHADFMSGRATGEFLKAALMDQRDPNTISGLLKLHLREHPFLCPASVSALDKVLEEANREEIVPTVLGELSSRELNVLTNIMLLLNTITQTPWKEQNKMSAHTLGIACGLSVFPDLNPSKATLLTEFLTIKYDDLAGSHTLL